MRCVAQCARLIAACNIVVFSPLAVPPCSLYSESLSITNLVSTSKATTVDFGRHIIAGGKNNRNNAPSV